MKGAESEEEEEEFSDNSVEEAGSEKKRHTTPLTNCWLLQQTMKLLNFTYQCCIAPVTNTAVVFI